MNRFVLALLVPLSTVLTPASPANAQTTATPRYVDTQRSLIVRPTPAAVATATLSRWAQSLHTSAAQLRQAWSRVAWCEVHGDWHMQGPNYSGIGFANTTWVGSGGLRYAPNAGAATVDEQILVGMRITGGWVPDQNGCQPGGW